MPVIKDAFIPARVGEVNPNPEPKKEGDTSFYRKKAEEARARLDYAEAEKMIENIKTPPVVQEPPIKIGGSINLGNFDLQEQGRQAAETLKAERQESNERLKTAEAEAAKTRDELSKARMDHLTEQFNTKLNELKAAVTQGMNQKSFIEQYKELTEMAGLLGLQRSTVGTGGDSIEILKLQQQMKMDDRTFQREMKKDERMWQLELKKMEQADRQAEEKLKAERERNAMLYSIPERIGGAIGGAMIGGSETGGGVSDRPANKPVKEKTQQFHVEAPPGEAGELDCPQCKSKIGFGPTSQGIECIKCHYKMKVVRIQAEPAPPNIPPESPVSTSGEIAGAEPMYSGRDEE